MQLQHLTTPPLGHVSGTPPPPFLCPLTFLIQFLHLSFRSPCVLLSRSFRSLWICEYIEGKAYN